MIDLNQQKEKIIKVDFILNGIMFLISIFYFKGWIIFPGIIINIILLGAYWVLLNYGYIFTGLMATNKIVKNLNNRLENSQ